MRRKTHCQTAKKRKIFDRVPAQPKLRVYMTVQQNKISELCTCICVSHTDRLLTAVK